MNALQLCPALVVLVATGIATVTDVRSFKIYNVLTVPLIISGLVYHLALYQGAGLVGSLAGACFGGGLLLIIYLLGGTGAGDVKLMAGVGAWLGIQGTFYVLIASSLAAGVYSLVILALYGGFRRTINNIRVIYYQIHAISSHLGPEETAETLVQSGQNRRLIPYGAMVIVGTIAWIFWERVTK